MCRIMIGKNVPLSEDTIEHLMFFLNKDSGGHGTGFGLGKRDTLSVYKTESYRHAIPSIAEYFKNWSKNHEYSFTHFRMASVGSLDIQRTHPVHTIEEDELNWTPVEANYMDLVSLIDVKSPVIIHNGTVHPELRFSLRMLLMENTDINMSGIVQASDTQLMYEFIRSEYGGLPLESKLQLLTEISPGVVVYLNTHLGNSYVVNTSSRPLYGIKWDQDSWMLVSNISPSLLTNLDKHVNIYEINLGVYQLNKIFTTRRTEGRYMGRNEVDKRFLPVQTSNEVVQRFLARNNY